MGALEPQDPRDLFERYRSERREAAIPGYDLHVLPHLTRYVSVTPGGEGMVMFARLPDEDALRLIHEQVAFFEARGEPFEWKIYDFDAPRELRSLLEGEGFAPRHLEAFMVRRAEPMRSPRIDGVEVMRATRENEVVADVARLQEQVWNCPMRWLEPQLRSALSRDPVETAIYCAYAGDRPVGTGWIDFTRGSSFADLHGGAVIEGARGRGIYTLLYEARVAAALERGAPFLAVDAAPMSRPILERKGFRAICDTYPMRRVDGRGQPLDFASGWRGEEVGKSGVRLEFAGPKIGQKREFEPDPKLSHYSPTLAG